jgi:hypothetical protein
VAGLFTLSLTSTGKPKSRCSTIVTHRSWISVNGNVQLYYFIWNIHIGASVTNLYNFQSHTQHVALQSYFTWRLVSAPNVGH